MFEADPLFLARQLEPRERLLIEVERRAAYQPYLVNLDALEQVQAYRLRPRRLRIRERDVTQIERLLRRVWLDGSHRVHNLEPQWLRFIER